MIDAPLTARQSQVLGLIRASLMQHGRAPTVREICRSLGLKSSNGGYCHLKALAHKGYLRLGSGRGMRGKARALQLVVPAGCCAACGARLEARP